MVLETGSGQCGDLPTVQGWAGSLPAHPRRRAQPMLTMQASPGSGSLQCLGCPTTTHTFRVALHGPPPAPLPNQPLS